MNSLVEYIKRPGPGRIVVQEVSISNEIEITQDSGKKVLLAVVNDDRSEGKIARVVAVAQPWVEEALDRVHNPEYDLNALVVIGRWTGTTVMFDREKYTILREEDVLCELNSAPKLMPATMTDADTVTSDEHADDKAFTEALISGASTPL